MTIKKNPESLSPEIYRLIDANLNRLREGIRVVEDIERYIFNNKESAKKLKNIRHLAKVKEQIELLKYRDSVNDVLRPTQQNELNRDNLESVIIANFKRTQEASRTLEEIYKIISNDVSENFKTIRYNLYELEKEVLCQNI